MCLFSIQLIILKIFRILKIVRHCQHPLPGEECGVTYQPQMLEPLLTRWCDWNKVNKYGGSCPRGQSLLRYQPVCLWYHYTLRNNVGRRKSKIVWHKPEIQDCGFLQPHFDIVYILLVGFLRGYINIFCHSACSVCLATDTGGWFETMSDQPILLTSSVQTGQVTSLLNMHSASLCWYSYIHIYIYF